MNRTIPASWYAYKKYTVNPFRFRKSVIALTACIITSAICNTPVQAQTGNYFNYNYIDLDPTDSRNSVAMGYSNNTVVGQVLLDPLNSNNTHAALWNSLSPGSFVDLNPSGYNASWAMDIQGSTAVGWGSGPATGDTGIGQYYQQALVWQGTTATNISSWLPNASTTHSYATGIDGTTVVGYTSSKAFAVDLGTHAVTDLAAIASTSLGAIGITRAFQVSGRYIVGDYMSAPAGSKYHAILWDAQSQSARDLHPTGYLSSYATDVWGNYTVGYAEVATGITTPYIWNNSTGIGTALPYAGFSSAAGYSIAGEWIVGVGAGQSGGQHSLLLWHVAGGTVEPYQNLSSFYPTPTGTNFGSISTKVGTDGTVVSSMSFGGGNHAFALVGASAPEPSSAALVLLGGGAGLRFFSRRRSSI